MRSIRSGVLVAAVLAVVGPLAGASGASAAIHRPVPFQRGVTIADWGTTAYGGKGFRELVRSLKARGVDTVTLLVVWRQDGKYSINITPDSGTVTTGRLVNAINTAHAAHLRVILKPYIDVRSGLWRGKIKPRSVPEWFANYDAFILRYAKLAQREHVQGFVVGMEMQTMQGYAERWRALVHKVRQVYRAGFVAYQANHTEAQHENITWWDAVDVIDISAYYPLNRNGSYDVPDLIQGWSPWYSLLQGIHRTYHRAVMFGEIGYTPYTGTFRAPASTKPIGSFKPVAQANGYTAAFDVWWPVRWFKGFEWWYVSSDPALRGTDSGNDEPRVPALKVLSYWYLNQKPGAS
jgi:hypothetical protein